MDKERTMIDFLDSHRQKQPVSFHMPGHKGRTTLYKKYGCGRFTENMFGNDITEIPGADALQQPDGVIRNVMRNYADMYGAKHTELLVNGSSAGIIAAIMASVPIGGKIIVGRNSHKSVFSALRLGGIRPVYVSPEVDAGYGLQAELSVDAVERALMENTDADAVLVTSPNYYGVLSDVGRLAKVIHSYGKILIVDQAHGAHLKFFDDLNGTKFAAEGLDADIVIDSTHKTLLSFTGSAILNVCSDRVDADSISELLRMLQTTSPSYLLMGSLDANERIMRTGGMEIVGRWQEDLQYFYSRSREISGLTVVTGPKMDRTKINISMRELGISGDQLNSKLISEHIWPEMVHGDYVMLMTGAGNMRDDYSTVIALLKDISSKYGIGTRPDVEAPEIPEPIRSRLTLADIPVKKEKMPLYMAEGRVLYEPLIPFPPGIPVACPGEILDYDMIMYLRKLMAAGETVIGLDEEGEIYVGADE